MLIALIIIVGLSLLILGHEAGHFFVAKLFGLKVDEFGFGFPPRIFAWRRGETEYSLNWLPFGGFVRIAGERGEMEMVKPETADMVPGSAEKNGTESTEASGSGAAAGPDGALQKTRLFNFQPTWKKSLVLLAGVFMNFILGWLFITLTLSIGAPSALIISAVQPGSPAASVGLMSGDVVKNYSDPQQFINYVDGHLGQNISFSVIRNDKEISITATPRTNPAPGQGALGVELSEAGAPRENFLTAIRDGAENAGIILWLTIKAFGGLVAQLFTSATLPAGVVGPVGIVGIAEETGKIGLAYLLQLIGIISINLTVVNLIPFPALDGGRFVMAIIEKIKGSEIPYKIEAWINGVGFALLILLIVALTARDIGGLI